MRPFAFFTRNLAAQQVRLAEDRWNSRDPEYVAVAYAPECDWRIRTESVSGRTAIARFLSRKWANELDYRIIKEMWAFNDRRISVRSACEWHNVNGDWFRSYGNEHWEFDDGGLVRRHFASFNDVSIAQAERKFHWPLWRRPDDYPSLSELGL